MAKSSSLQTCGVTDLKTGDSSWGGGGGMARANQLHHRESRGLLLSFTPSSFQEGLREALNKENVLTGRYPFIQHHIYHMQ